MYANESPSVIEFSNQYVEKVFKHGNPSAILFYKEKESDLVTAFSNAAKDFKGQLVFVTSGITHGIQQKISSFVGVKTIPSLVIIKPPTGGPQAELSKFELEDVNDKTSQE